LREPFIAEIGLFPTESLPDGWLPCDGRTLPIRGNQALFALIGTRFGGDGVQNFALPDLNGRAPVGTGRAQGSFRDDFFLGQKVDVPASGPKVEQQKATGAVYAISTKGRWPSRD
jgi:microcystin-dependent protein